ncbi:MAG: LTA synthase family protein [Methylococcaceae bacterium]
MKQTHKFTHIKADLLFLISSTIYLLVLQALLRILLLWRNSELSTAIPNSELANSFLVGLRFDLIMTSYVMIPLVLGLLHPRGINQKIAVIWLAFVASFFTFLSVLELDFYHEFHVRLNSLVFQYIREDAETVISMVWYGFPVIRYFVLIGVISCLFYWILSKTSHRIIKNRSTGSSYLVRCCSFVLVTAVTVVAARGTVRSGPPLRWGDAFHSEYLFANHLALNGSYTLTKAFIAEFKEDNQKHWLGKMPKQEAIDIIQKLLFTEKDSLINPEHSPVFRTYQAGSSITKSQKPNVVLILMESFSGAFVDSLGHDYGITPEFDRLRERGVLFENFFSNGTHTHQGMFASMACFPNLPGYETLMQLPQGDTKFAGVLKIVKDRDYQSLYVYNGDFAWDNQRGFFGGQGMERFIGRHDYVNPKFSDPTWGVSDEDMFNRAAEEIDKIPADTPFFAFLQSLSNHTPYALPDPLPMDAITGFGGLDEHLTAMRYSDWALGEFFRKIEQSEYYNNTIFIIVGDHAFSTNNQVTNIDLLRYHVPLLILGPNIVEKYGSTQSIVGSQVDIAPVIAGLLGGESSHSCWGRDLLNVNDAGFAVIKPSGSDQSTAYIDGDVILVKQPHLDEKLYRYQLGKQTGAELVSDHSKLIAMNKKLEAFIQTAMDALLHGKAGYE